MLEESAASVPTSDDVLFERAQLLLSEGQALESRGDARGAMMKYEACRAAGQAMQDQGYAQAVEAAALGSLGTAYDSLGQYDKATEHLTAALAISREIGDRQGEGSGLANLGVVHLTSLNDPAAALPFIQEAAAAFDAIWSGCRTDEQLVSIGDTTMPTIIASNLQLAYVQLGQPEAALEAAERARSRAFELLLAQQRSQLTSPVAVAPVLQRQATGVAAVDVTVLRSLAVRQGAALVIFSVVGNVGQMQLFAWLVRSSADSPLVFKQVTIPEHETSLTQLVELTRCKLGVRARDAAPKADRGVKLSVGSLVVAEALATPTIDKQKLEVQLGQRSEDALLRRCHELLIAPLSDELANETSLIIIPDRDLYALPFAALRDGNGTHLIEKHTLRIAPSAGTLIELEQRVASRMAGDDGKPAALVVGDPSFHRKDLPPLTDLREKASQYRWAHQLPGARAEADEVVKKLQAEHRTTYLYRDQ